MTVTERSAPSVAAGTAVPAIETAGLTKVYPGDILAVDRLDLVVGRGEIFGLLGPNGAGKTTTAGMLTTRVVPTAGSARVGGIDVVASPAEAKRLIGVVPQTNTLDRSLTVWENLYFHGRFFGMDAPTAKSEATRLLEQFRLAERAGAPVMALSGGMAQRLMVARAVMHRPQVLFLDEPTAGLDPQSRIALWEILRDLHVDGQTILLTTHYMEEADLLCDRVAIIDQGRIVALDTPAELKRSIGMDATVRIVADGDLEALGTAAARRARRRHRRHRPRRRPRARRARRRCRAAARRAHRRAQRLRRLGPVGQRDHARDRVHHPHRKGPPRMSVVDLPITSVAPTPRRLRATRSSAFAALLLRDLTVLRKNLKEFIPRTILQPLLLVFVFTYVFPKIGQGVGGGGAAAATFSSVLVAGVVATAILFQGIQAVALPLVQEFGYTREIEDRVLAPLPVSMVGLREDRRRCAAVPGGRPDRVPDRRRRAGDRRAPRHQLGDRAHAHPDRVRHERRPRADVRHHVQPPVGADAVRRGR